MSAEPRRAEIPRPSLGPAVWLTAGTWLGCAGAEAFTWWAARAGYGVVATLWTLAGLGAAGAACWAVARARGWGVTGVAVAYVGFALGCAVGALYWTHLDGIGRALTVTPGGRWTLVATGDPREGEFGPSSDAVIVQPDGSRVSARVSWPEGQAPSAGERLEVFGSVGSSAKEEARRAARQRGTAVEVRVRRVRSRAWDSSVSGWCGRLRAWAADRTAAVPGEGGALLASSLLGDKRRVAGTELETALQASGLAHFEATSGFHLIFLSGLMTTLLLQLGVPRRARVSGVGLATLGFVALSGWRTAVVRGWVMALVGSAAGEAGRRADALSSLAVAAELMLLADPTAALDAGFAMSVLGVAGIVTFARLTEAWIRVGLPRRMVGVAGSVAVTLCAVVATLPVSGPAFGLVSAVGPAANVVAAPLVSALLLLGPPALFVSALSAPVGGLALRVAATPAAMLASVARWFASLPHAAVPLAGGSVAFAVVVGALGVAAWTLWPRPRRAVARLALVGALLGPGTLGLTACGPVSAQVEVLNVGQGDAILLSDSGHSLLVDTGPTARAIGDALARARPRQLDGVVLTHFHADHTGGLGGVATFYGVPRVYVSWGATGRDSSTLVDARRIAGGQGAVTELGAGDHIRVGRIDCEVLAPRSPVDDAATNEASIVMVARCNGDSVLLTGDAERGVLGEIAQAGALPRVDVLKVGHHGSAITVTPELLAALQPRAALISCGTGNRYGHPKPVALRMLSDAAILTYRTDFQGDLTVRMDPGGCRILTQRDAPVSRGGRCRTQTVACAPAWGSVDPAAPARSVRSCEKIPSETGPTPPDPNPEPHVRLARRSQTRLPDLRYRGPPAAARARSPAPAGGCRRGPRLQLRHLRG